MYHIVMGSPPIRPIDTVPEHDHSHRISGRAVGDGHDSPRFLLQVATSHVGFRSAVGAFATHTEGHECT